MIILSYVLATTLWSALVGILFYEVKRIKVKI